MPRLYSSRHIIRILNKYGFHEVSRKGSHAKLKNEAGRVVIVPDPKPEIPPGTFDSILKQSGLSKTDFAEK